MNKTNIVMEDRSRTDCSIKLVKLGILSAKEELKAKEEDLKAKEEELKAKAEELLE